MPVPTPAFVTVTTSGTSMKLAVTEVGPLTETRQVVLMPLQTPPDQPVNVDPDAAVAVSVVIAPLAKLSAQAVPQLIDPELAVTVPAPVPPLATDSV